MFFIVGWRVDDSLLKDILSWRTGLYASCMDHHVSPVQVWLAPSLQQMLRSGRGCIDREHGLLAPVEDVNPLVEAVLQLPPNIESRCEMGISAWHRIEQVYTIDRMCLQYLDAMLDFPPEKK